MTQEAGRLPNLPTDRLALLYKIGQKLGATLEIDELTNIANDLFANDLGLDTYALLLATDEAAQCHAVRGERGMQKAGSHAASLYSAPIARRDKILGYLQIPNAQWEGWAEEDRLLIQAILAQIAIAFDNARLYAKTRDLSIRDELTGLFNRRHFDRALKTEWARALRFERPLALAMIDVDHFKEFNDTHGHLEGDKVLKEIARVLGAHTREVDTVARFGGEEFAVILPNTAAPMAGLVGEKLRRLVASQTLRARGETDVQLTVSVGIAAYPEDAASIEELVDRADAALYDAKRAGRNCIVAFGAKKSLPFVETVEK